MEVRPIGVVRSCWRDRFGIPRQPRLVPAAWATIELAPDVPEAALAGLEGFSHLWVVFAFHAVSEEKWTVRPPRLGGNRRRGVLATRSPHRPNRLGLSVVELAGIEFPRVHLRAHDLLDGTPVLDLKPYLPYADALPDARGGWAEDPIPRREVRFDPEPARIVAERPDLGALIVQTFAVDPRPAGRRWPRAAVWLADVDVHAELVDEAWVVRELRPRP